MFMTVRNSSKNYLLNFLIWSLFICALAMFTYTLMGLQTKALARQLQVASKRSKNKQQHLKNNFYIVTIILTYFNCSTFEITYRLLGNIRDIGIFANALVSTVSSYYVKIKAFTRRNLKESVA